jgi:hypothetical protein
VGDSVALAALVRSCALVCTFALMASRAYAQASPEAEALFREGKSLMEQGKFAEACAAFDESHKLEPNTSTLLNAADCRDKNRQYATAWAMFLEVQRLTRGVGDDAVRALNDVARDRAAKLEARLSRLTIEVPTAARLNGLTVMRNGTPIATAVWGRPMPIDGGTFEITVTAPGHITWSRTVVVDVEADTKSVEIPILEVAPPDESDSEETALEPAPQPRNLTLPIGFAAGAVVFLGVAGGFELSARSTYDDAVHEPDWDEQDRLWHSANTKRYLAEGFAVAGLAAGGVAVWMYMRSGREEPRTTAWRIAPAVQGDSVVFSLERSMR